MSKAHTFSVRVTDEAIKLRIQQEARRENRSVSSYLLWLHMENVKAMDSGVPVDYAKTDAK
jgi:hypothetical protein